MKGKKIETKPEKFRSKPEKFELKAEKFELKGKKAEFIGQNYRSTVQKPEFWAARLNTKEKIARFMKPSTKRTILRTIHLVSVIPVLGYVYQPVAEAAQYQRFTQFVFIPLAIFTGYWMYMGLIWAVIGVAAWVGLNYFVGGNAGFGYALLAEIVIFVVRLISKKAKTRPVAAEL